jgi:negative regulator of sigma E activity
MLERIKIVKTVKMATQSELQIPWNSYQNILDFLRESEKKILKFIWN